MSMSKLQKHAYKLFGTFAEKKTSETLKHSLESAHMDVRGSVYLSSAILYTLIVLIISAVVITIFLLLIFPFFTFTLDMITTIFFVVLPFIVAGLTFVIYLQIPASKAKARGKKIDANLAYALNYVSAMSSAGVTPTEIFHSLSKQEVYGEVKEEAAWIYRDVSLLGKDILSAIRDNIKRTPSEKFREFLQGLVVTVTSGGSLKTYFVAKAKQYMVENRQRQKQMIENLGIMAESYVTAAVAGILLMFIVIPVMMIISGDPGQLSFMYIIIFPIVPLIHAGFAFVIRSMTLEV